MTIGMTMAILEIDMTIAKNVIKAKLLEYFRYVESSGEEIIVTEYARLNPVKVLKIFSGNIGERLKFRGMFWRRPVKSGRQSDGIGYLRTYLVDFGTG